MFADVFGTHKLRRFWSPLTILLAFSVLGLMPQAIAQGRTQTRTRIQSEEKCVGAPQQVQLSRSQAVRVIGKYSSYTQGLIYSDKELYESTGLPGESALVAINTDTGMPRTLLKLSGNSMGGGLTMLNGEIFQLSKNQNLVFHHRGQVSEVLTLPTPGWGLTSLNDQLVISDGTPKIRFVDPKTMKATREIVARRGYLRFSKLNELEIAKGNILANVEDSDIIAVIRPSDGCIMGLIDVVALRTADTREAKDAKCANAKCTAEDFATNGIAYDAINDELYITGRNWPYIFKFKFPVEL